MVFLTMSWWNNDEINYSPVGDKSCPGVKKIFLHTPTCTTVNRETFAVKIFSLLVLGTKLKHAKFNHMCINVPGKGSPTTKIKNLR